MTRAGHHTMLQDVLLPGGAKQIEYIQNTGLEYITTDLVPNVNLVIRMEFTLISTDGSWVVGSFPWNDSSDLRFFRQVGTATAFHDRGSGRVSGSKTLFTGGNNEHYAVEVGNMYVLDIPTNARVLSGTTQSHSFSSDKRMRIFGLYESSNGSKVPTVAQLNWIQFLLNGTLLHDFIPARKKSVGGLFDRVDNSFWENSSGNGAFVLGPDGSYQQGGGRWLLLCRSSRARRSSERRAA